MSFAKSTKACMDASEVLFAKLKAVQPHLARRVAVTHFEGHPKGVLSKALDYSQLFPR